jgi:hypothetical protein
MPSGHYAANGAWCVTVALAANVARWTTLLGLGQTTPRAAATLRRRLLVVPGRSRRLTPLLCVGIDPRRGDQVFGVRLLMERDLAPSLPIEPNGLFGTRRLRSTDCTGRFTRKER